MSKASSSHSATNPIIPTTATIATINRANAPIALAIAPGPTLKCSNTAAKAPTTANVAARDTKVVVIPCNIPIDCVGLVKPFITNNDATSNPSTAAIRAIPFRAAPISEAIHSNIYINPAISAIDCIAQNKSLISNALEYVDKASTTALKSFTIADIMEPIPEVIPSIILIMTFIKD